MYVTTLFLQSTLHGGKLPVAGKFFTSFFASQTYSEKIMRNLAQFSKINGY